MLRKIAQTFSICFHPLLMSTLGVILLLYTDSYIAYIADGTKYRLILLTIIGTLLLPVMMVPVFFLQQKISDISLQKHKERVYPLAITSVFYFLTYLLFRRIPVFPFMQAFMLGSFIAVFLSAGISYKWKISAHMIGLGGITGLVLVASIKLNLNLYYSLLGLLIAAGITGSSRIYLNAHSLNQVYAGYFLGILVMVSTLFLY